nr:helix-turn-helix transcriptional regulator [Kibdelosporangium sp. MJ126-NF4]CEL14012.1 hypothetical protein [Kibdelosporangium sp. MJ126-NF4]CTQ88379.1 hypothetical protein [Kibdelosporangium sp. MJ126-NF4]
MTSSSRPHGVVSALAPGQVPVSPDRTVVLRDRAQAVVSGGSAGVMPEIDLISLGRVVRVGMNQDGLTVLATAVEWLVACMKTGARAGQLVVGMDSLIYPDELGVRIRAARWSTGLSINQMSKRMNVKAELLSAVEKGQRKPTPMFVAKAAFVADVSLADLLEPWSYLDGEDR